MLFRSNGYAAGGLVLLVVAGLVAWWPRGGGWRRAFRIEAARGWRRLLFDAHGLVGVATLVFALAWGVTGLYLTFPAGFRAAVSSFSPLTVRRALPTSDATGADAHTAPEPAELVRRAVAAVPGSRPARYTRPTRAADPVVVLLALDEVGDRLTDDEVSVYFDRYTGAWLATRPERGVTWGDWLLVWLFPIHAGWFGGWISRLVWVVAALALVALYPLAKRVTWWPQLVMGFTFGFGAPMGYAAASGEADYASALSPIDIRQIEGRREIKLDPSIVGRWYGLQWQLDRPPFNDPKVRQAVAHAVDRKKIVDIVMSGKAPVAETLTPRGLWWHDPALRGPTFSAPRLSRQARLPPPVPTSTTSMVGT